MIIKDLLYIIANQFKSQNNYGISRTKLIKLAYLAEVFYKRQIGRRLTDSKWVFWKYGPYLMEYPNILDSNAFTNTMSEDDFQPVEPAMDYEPPAIEMEEEITISRAMEFADDDLNDLLDFVYFDTEPMIFVTSRGQELNFDHVKPEETYKVKKYIVTEEVKRDIGIKIGGWKKDKGEAK